MYSSEEVSDYEVIRTTGFLGSIVNTEDGLSDHSDVEVDESTYHFSDSPEDIIKRFEEQEFIPFIDTEDEDDDVIRIDDDPQQQHQQQLDEDELEDMELLEDDTQDSDNNDDTESNHNVDDSNTAFYSILRATLEDIEKRARATKKRVEKFDMLEDKCRRTMEKLEVSKKVNESLQKKLKKISVQLKKEYTKSDEREEAQKVQEKIRRDYCSKLESENSQMFWMMVIMSIFFVVSFYNMVYTAIRPIPTQPEVSDWKLIGKLEDELVDAIIVKDQVEKYCDARSALLAKGINHHEWIRHFPETPNSCKLMIRKLNKLHKDYNNLEQEFTAYRLKTFMMFEIILAIGCGLFYSTRSVIIFIWGMVYSMLQFIGIVKS